jgi:hypothetical protein
MIMELFFRRRWIADNIEGKILPSIINILKARIKGLGHLSLAKGDHYVAEVQDNNNMLAKHVVEAHMKYCSCLEWQHTGKPCQHALVIIVAQPYKDVGMKYFVDDYFSVEKFKKAYARLVEPLADRGSWPKVPFAAEVSTPILKRVVGR